MSGITLIVDAYSTSARLVPIRVMADDNELLLSKELGLDSNEPDVPRRHSNGRPCGSVYISLVREHVAVPIHFPFLNVDDGDPCNPHFGKSVQLDRLRHAVVVPVLPKAQAGIDTIPSVDDLVTVVVLRQSKKAVRFMARGRAKFVGVLFPNISDPSLMTPSVLRSRTSQASSLCGSVHALSLGR